MESRAHDVSSSHFYSVSTPYFDFFFKNVYSYKFIVFIEAVWTFKTWKIYLLENESVTVALKIVGSPDCRPSSAPFAASHGVATKSRESEELTSENNYLWNIVR